MGDQKSANIEASPIELACKGMRRATLPQGDYRVESRAQQAASQNSGASSSHSEKTRPDLIGNRPNWVLAATLPVTRANRELQTLSEQATAPSHTPPWLA